MNRSMAVVFVITLAVALSVTPNRARAQAEAGSIAGAWTLNTDLSDKPEQWTQADGGDRNSGGGYGRGGGRYGGRGRGGGFGGGGFGGQGRQPGTGSASPEDRERMRQAMREIMDAPSRLTITETSSMITVVTGDGRITRLAPNGKGIKDEATRIERKTKWDHGKLVSEISGAGRGKITETYAIDPEHHRLTVTLQMETPRGPQARVIHRVYDAQPL